MKPTIKDVAKRANVSISTVSRVMNAPETVIEEKRLRVQEAIEALQYQPNALARGLISRKSNTIAALIPDTRNPFYAGVIRGMEDAAKKLGYNLILCNTDRDKSHLVSYLESFYEKQIDGILFCSDVVYPDYYAAMQRYKMPVVLVSTHSLEYELPSIRVNEEQAAFEAIEHLIQLGHKNIGMISFPMKDSISGIPRYQGFLRALSAHGLEYCGHKVEFAELWYEEAYEAAARLFGIFPDLTAIFTASDEFAMAVISYLHDQGRTVPADVSVVGFDDIRFAGMMVPKLTTIAQPAYDMGSQSVEKLHELILNGKVETLRDILPHKLVVRASTGPVGGTVRSQ